MGLTIAFLLFVSLIVVGITYYLRSISNRINDNAYSCMECDYCDKCVYNNKE